MMEKTLMISFLVNKADKQRLAGNIEKKFLLRDDRHPN
jgi:hypothetical protein